ncbi:Large-conductance mechanosensitive channel [Streptomyces aurantiogriseus]
MSESKKESSVWQDFKAFLMRGNVVDLAVAVVIGAAFTNIVNSVVKGIINPLVGAFGTKNLDSYSSCLKGPCTGTGDAATGVRILWGSVLGATLSFVITAAVVYFLMVLPMSKYLARQEARRKARESTHEAIEVTELEVLKEIRDALVAQRGSRGDNEHVSGAPGRTDEILAASAGTPRRAGRRASERRSGAGVVVEEALTVGRLSRAGSRPLEPTRRSVSSGTAGPAGRRRSVRRAPLPRTYWSGPTHIT